MENTSHSQLDLIYELSNDDWSLVLDLENVDSVCFYYFIALFTTVNCAEKWTQEKSNTF